MNYLSVAISVMCGAISFALVSALIFNRAFRRDVLGVNGETHIFGLFTAKGAVIIVLSALFLAGMLFPIILSNSECRGALEALKMGLDDKERYIAKSSDVEVLQETIKALGAKLDKADKSCR